MRGTVDADVNGAWTITVTDTLSGGTQGITAKAVDVPGNVSSPSTPLSVTVDATPP
ncbi:MAG: Ig-like domain-containing protein [Spirochaetota bacterium]